MTRNRASAKKASEAAAAKLLAIPVEGRLRDSSRVTDAGCWEWTRYRYSNGYAALSVNGKQRLAHRVAYETFVAPIPEGLTIDRLCRNRACVNPGHLEPVTSGENTRRAMRSHCVNGHPFNEENTWMHKGKRYCRECRRRRNREQQRKKHDA